MNRMSPRTQYACHHRVSVRAGSRHTTNSAFVCDSSLSFLHPLADLAAVRRIHEHPACPLLFQAASGFGDEPFAVRVLWSCAKIKCEVKTLIECFKEVPWRAPFVAPAGKENRIEHSGDA